jgi:hypothetical protein
MSEATQARGRSCQRGENCSSETVVGVIGFDGVVGRPSFLGSAAAARAPQLYEDNLRRLL